MGLFTGLTLTALVLILNSPTPFHAAIGPLSGPQYFQLVTTYVGVESVISSVTMLVYLEVAGGLARPFSFSDKLGTTLFFASLFGFMGILPLLLAPFTPLGSAVVLTFIVFLLAVYFVGRRVPLADPRTPSAGPHGGEPTQPPSK